MSSPDRSTYLHLSRRSWAALGAMLIIPWLLLVWVLLRPAPPAPAAPVPPKLSVAAPGASQFTPLPAGPWGKLEFSRIVTEPPSEFIPVGDGRPEPLRWFFRGYTPESLRTLWEKAGLTAAQQQSLIQPERNEAVVGAMVIHPDPAVVITLAPAARGIIYAALAKFPENTAQHLPFRLRADLAPDWFKDSGLPPEIVTLVQQLFYPRASNLCFADQDIILPRLESPEMRVRFLKTLSRKSAMLVQLRVDHGTDIEPLAAYWGHGRRSKDVRPLLQSLVARPDGGSVDIVHLLPPFARSLLYTYPLPSDTPADAAHDCHWSAFNFHRDQPDERFANIDFVKETLLGSYYPVVGEPALGDIIVLVQPDGVVVHSCVYVAADIVFTKNGASFSVPWLLGNLDQVVAFYSLGSPLEVRRYRSKDR